MDKSVQWGIVDLGLFFRGVALGFSIAVPVGPIGLLCIRRTLAEGRAIGLASGLGAATADGIYGAIAGFGLTVISDLLVNQQNWIRLIGGLFLLYLGVRIYLSRPATEPAVVTGTGLRGAYLSTLLLTLTNPATILSFVLIFSSFGLNTSGNRAFSSAALLVLGVPIGSALWWLILSSGVSLLRTRFNYSAMQWVNRIAGVIIIGFGVLAVISLISH